ncbi:MAG TPA: heme A synthase [Savagea sp.]
MSERTLRILGIASTIGMLLLLLSGALVTKMDSGLGCGRHWPGCNGQLIPTEITQEVLIEFSHRVVTGVVGLLIVAFSYFAYRAKGYLKEVRFLAISSVFFLILQALIGAAQVLWGQGSFILALHFGISLLSFTSVLLLTLLLFESPYQTKWLPVDPFLKRQTIAVTIYTYLVIYTGALVRHTKSEIVCPSFPFCHDGTTGPWQPQFFEEYVHMGHRFAALLLFVWIVSLAIYTARRHGLSSFGSKRWIVLSGLVIAQALVGLLIVWTQAHLIAALLHSLIVAILFGLLSYLLLLYYRESRA